MTTDTLTICQVADALGLSVHTLRKWYRANKLNGCTVTPTGHRHWQKQQLPQLIIEVATMLHHRPNERRTLDEIAEPMIARWHAYISQESGT